MGRGRFKRGEAKKAVMAFCRMLRYAPNNDNEADAIIGFLYQSALLNPRTAHLSTPLFAAG
jgi:cytochrome c-type biogenesis protein CcmH/NrfG